MLEHAVSSDQESDEVWWRAEEFETADRDALDNMRGKDNTNEPVLPETHSGVAVARMTLTP